MPITRARKEELVSQYVDMLEQSAGFVVFKYGGLPVQEIDKLRAKVREAEGSYVVTKNTLLIKALEQLEVDAPRELLSGPTSVAFGMTNFPGVAKAVLDFVDENKDRAQKLYITGGMMGPQTLDTSGVEAASKLPTLDELRASLVGLLVAPQQNVVNVLHSANGQLVNVLHAGTTQLVNVLQAYINKQNEGAA